MPSQFSSVLLGSFSELSYLLMLLHVQTYVERFDLAQSFFSTGSEWEMS